MDYEALDVTFPITSNEFEQICPVVVAKPLYDPLFKTHIKAGEPATVAVPSRSMSDFIARYYYMVPVRIKSAGDVEINEEKNFVLYRIQLVNKYSSTTSRSYKMKGTKHPDGSFVSNITTNKIIFPIAYNQVRLFPENLTTVVTLEAINDRSIVLVINEDNPVRVKPYKYVQVEQTGECKYDPEEKEFTLNYRYRLPSDTRWTTVYEILTRLE